MDMNTRQMINKMFQAKCILENSNIVCKNNVDYNKIMSDIKTFLSNYCIHELKIDNIDITPERSQQITYCELCETCFRYQPKSKKYTNSSLV